MPQSAEALFLSPLLDDPGRPWRLENTRTRRVVASRLETAFDSASRRRGLLGRESLAAGAALIIAPCSSVHTFFMRFPIDILFVARDGRVVGTSEDLRPWRLAAGWGALATIELPSGTLSSSECRRGDVVRLVGEA